MLDDGYTVYFMDLEYSEKALESLLKSIADGDNIIFEEVLR